MGALDLASGTGGSGSSEVSAVRRTGGRRLRLPFCRVEDLVVQQEGGP